MSSDRGRKYITFFYITTQRYSICSIVTHGICLCCIQFFRQTSEQALSYCSHGCCYAVLQLLELGGFYEPPQEKIIFSEVWLNHFVRYGRSIARRGSSVVVPRSAGQSCHLNHPPIVRKWSFQAYRDILFT